jgi:hypothetical protein
MRTIDERFGRAQLLVAEEIRRICSKIATSTIWIVILFPLWIWFRIVVAAASGFFLRVFFNLFSACDPVDHQIAAGKTEK